MVQLLKKVFIQDLGFSKKEAKDEGDVPLFIQDSMDSDICAICEEAILNLEEFKGCTGSCS